MCQRSKGKGDEFRRETAREGEGRRGASPFLLPRLPFGLPTHPYPLFLPFSRLDYLSNSGEKWNVFTCNIKILVNSFPCFSLRLCYIYIYIYIFFFFPCQCSLVQCDIKAFNKRHCLTVCTNLVRYFS